MIKEVKMFTVICDNCKADSNRNSEYSCWNDEGTARDTAMESDWHEEGDKHYCPDCFNVDDNDNVTININRFKEK